MGTLVNGVDPDSAFHQGQHCLAVFANKIETAFNIILKFQPAILLKL